MAFSTAEAGPAPNVPSPAGPAASDAPTRWSAFRRVVNLPHIAGAFYVAFALALSRAVTWRTPTDSSDGWWMLLAMYTRQCFISVACMLVFAGLAESLMRGTSRAPQAAWGLRALAVAAGSMVGAGVRFVVAYMPDFREPFYWSWFAYTSGICWLLGYMFYGLLHLIDEERAGRARLVQARQEREALAAQQMEAELSALQAQIEPHFLFNTLATVKRLYDVAPDRGRDMLSSLIAYLRSALPGMRRQRARLSDEFEQVRHYLAILQMRMGERLTFSVEMPPALRCAEVPPMVVATLVENAIKHGLSPRPEGGSVHVSAHQDALGRLVIEVRDDGQGFVNAGGTGVGLANTRARLAALYGAQAELSLEMGAQGGVLARVTLPCREGPAPEATTHAAPMEAGA